MKCERCKKPMMDGLCRYWRCLELRGLERRKLNECPVTFGGVRSHCTRGKLAYQIEESDR